MQTTPHLDEDMYDYRLELLMLRFSNEDRALVREAAKLSHTEALKLIHEIRNKFCMAH